MKRLTFALLITVAAAGVPAAPSDGTMTITLGAPGITPYKVLFQPGAYIPMTNKDGLIYGLVRNNPAVCHP